MICHGGVEGGGEGLVEGFHDSPDRVSHSLQGEVFPMAQIGFFDK